MSLYYAHFSIFLTDLLMTKKLALTICTITWLWTIVLCFFDNQLTTRCHHLLKLVASSVHSQIHQKYSSAQFMPNHANNVPMQNSCSLKLQHMCQDSDDQGHPYHDNKQKVKSSHPNLLKQLIMLTSYDIHETIHLLIY